MERGLRFCRLCFAALWSLPEEPDEVVCPDCGASVDNDFDLELGEGVERALQQRLK